MEPITGPTSTDHPLNQDRKKGGDRATARRQFFPRASGLPRGKVRTAGAPEHASKTNVGDMMPLPLHTIKRPVRVSGLESRQSENFGALIFFHADL
ncbi:hypothetical protein DHEL01_v207486 [Diaporthe helianthi]|uniref:Uncharacterized protein n=1 Tax=Diaporthe helianthi TaxID=158607 RepID=A0A2P5HV45_DIAHE|nr:hypothetical protein DHEL01_v207486 [Diaporthe helianthi]